MNYSNAFFKQPNTHSRERILFFPYAGGVGETYQPWFQFFNADIDCLYAMLPGRGRRMLEPAFDELNSLIDALFPEVLALMDKPLRLFGHSMGALIAFELARKLWFSHKQAVKQLYLSAHRAPCSALNRPPLHQLSERALVQQLQKAGGLPSQFSVEQLAPFLPTLYRDLKLCECYQYEKRPSLPIQMTILWAKDDDWIIKDKMSLWQQESSFSIRCHRFHGGHFYHQQHYLAIIQLIQNDCRVQLSPAQCVQNG